MNNMMEILEKYELSIWEDYIEQSDAETFEERKIAVLASSEMHNERGAFNVSIKENINGDKTLTFNLLAKYLNEKGELVDNPFLNLLTNERIIKLRDGEAYSFSDINDLNTIDIEEKWKDFIIKSIDEDNSTYINTYVCKEVYVNELGKNGWSIILDTELENNYGTLPELGKKILEGSGWEIAENSYNPTARVNEQLFVLNYDGENVKANNTLNNQISKDIYEGYVYFFYSNVESKENKWIVKDTTLDNEGPQIMYNNGSAFTTKQIDDNNVILDDNNEYNFDTPNGAFAGLEVQPVGSFNDPTQTSRPLLGGKIVKAINSHFEPIADKYVEDWEVVQRDEGENPILNMGEKVYSYVENEYATSDIIQNMLANSTNFVTEVGWYFRNGNTINDTFSFHTMEIIDNYPDFSDDWEQNEEYKNWLPTNYMVLPNSINSFTIHNEGPSNQHLRLIKDNIYVVRWKGRVIDKTADKYTDETVKTSGGCQLVASLVFGEAANYIPCTNEVTISNFLRDSTSINNNGKEKRGYPLISSDNINVRVPYNGNNLGTIYIDEQGYVYTYLKAIENTDVFGGDVYFQLKTGTGDNSNYCWHIKDIQLFDYKEQTIENDNSSKIIPIFPGDIPNATILSTRFFYRIKNTGTGKEAEYLPSDIKYYKGITRKDDNYAAIRHLEVKESNYFNNINSLAELFEVWVKFRIKHKKNGELYKHNGKPVKEIIFSKYAPNGDKENQAGFRYGVNLKNIKRSLNSANIVSKLIVKDNENEFAKSGLCSIRRAVNNPSGDNVIYNFDYYVNQGILNYTQMLSDLYGLLPKDLGYYDKMNKLNNQLLPLNELLIQFQGEISHAEEMIEYIQTSIDSAKEELLFQQQIYQSYKDGGIGDGTQEIKKIVIAQLKAKIATFEASLSEYEAQKDYYNLQINGTGILEYKGEWDSSIKYNKNSVISYKQNYELVPYISNKDNNNAEPGKDDSWTILIDETNLGIADRIDFISDKKRYLNLRFFTKYHRFIQEGTWINNQYIDDDLYYFDALKVSSQNAYPKTSYTISVINIDNGDFSPYKFNIGERTYVEDPEFFGYEYITIDGVGEKIKTPFKKQVIVSERTRNLDDPSKSTIVIQTYKNQFEELFSKMSATTTSLQYASGGYDRAANTITPDGEVKISSLEKAFENNSWILANSKNQNVTWDSGTGITITDNMNSSTALRLTSNGIMMTTDGGKTWINGITGNGINTRYLLSGQIDAEKINIISSSGNYAFKWNEDGISAISRGSDGNSYVRYNDLGIYGTNQGLTLKEQLRNDLSNEEKIKILKKYSNFLLTWDGLYLKSQNNGVALNPNIGLEIFDLNLKFPEETIKKYGYIFSAEQNDDSSYISYTTEDYIPLVTLGKVVDTEHVPNEHYGLRLRNKNGYITLDTNEYGNLWLQNSLQVGTMDEYQIKENYKEKVYVTRKTNGIEFSISNNKIIPNGEFYFEENKVTASYNPNNYNNIDLETVITIPFSLSGNELGDNFGLFETQYYTINYQITRTFNRFLGINGSTIADFNDKINQQIIMAEDPIILYAGAAPNYNTINTYNDVDNTKGADSNVFYEKATFKLFSSGKVIATEADIKGTIEATSGLFSGFINIGNTAGIDGSYASQYTFWSGNREDRDKPVFYVTQNGTMYAESAEIYGTIFADNGSFKGEIIADTGRINQLFFNDSNSYIGTGKGTSENSTQDSDIYLNINNNFLINKIGEYFGQKAFLSLNNNWNNIIGTINSNQIPYTVADFTLLFNFEPKLDMKIISYQENIEEENALLKIKEINNDKITYDKERISEKLIYNNQFFNSKNYYNVIIGENSDTYFTIYNNETIIPQSMKVFEITKNGNIEMNGTLVSNSDLVFNGLLKTLNNSITINGKEGSIYSNNWNINGNGSAFFENITARGEIKSAVFTYDNISSVGGELFISPSIYVLEEITGTLEEDNYVFDLSKYNINLLWANINKATVNIIGVGEINNCIVSYKNNKLLLYIPISILDNNILPIGTQIISTSTLVNSLRLTAKKPEGASIITRGNDVNGNRNTTIVGYIDKNEISSSTLSFFDDLDNFGYGLFADNAYITGKVYLPQAGVTNEGLQINFSEWENNTNIEQNKAVRFWAGAPPSQRYKAPFIVTQDGTLYAQDGYFRGIINAKESTFEGHIQASGVLLSDEQPEYSHFFFRQKEQEEPNPNNYIVDINNNGINIWEGSLNKFSDYYTNKNNKYYGYNENNGNTYYPTIDSPFPIFTILDNVTNNDNFVPKTVINALQIFEKSNTSYDYSINLYNNFINFNYFQTNYSDQFSQLSDKAWNNTVLSVGIEEKTGILISDNLKVRNLNQDTILKMENNLEENNITIYSNLSFSQVIQIKQLTDGISFIYIGE